MCRLGGLSPPPSAQGRPLWDERKPPGIHPLRLGAKPALSPDALRGGQEWRAAVIAGGGTEERPELKDQSRILQNRGPGTDGTVDGGAWAFRHFRGNPLSRTAVALALTWNFTKIRLGVEAHGIIVLFSSR